MVFTTSFGVLGAEPAAAAAAAPGGLNPSDIASAYNLPRDASGQPNGGNGATVALVEAGDSTNAESDMNTYRNQWGLPPCTSAAGCFRKVNQRNDNVPAGTISSGLNQNCMDVYGGVAANDTQVDLYQCISGNYMWWRLPGDGTVRSNANPQPFSHLNPNGDVGMCLDTRNGGTANGTAVVVNDCAHTNSQQWVYQNGALRNTASQRCLNANGVPGNAGTTSTLDLQDCNGSSRQQWTTNFNSIYPQPATGELSSGSTREWSLDVDSVSVVCPNCHILMVEADTFSLDSLGSAINEAVQLGAKYVSNSWAFTESSLNQNATQAVDNKYLNHPGVLLAFATGDSGYLSAGASYPASSPKALAVGGTTLARNPNVRRGWTESVWSHAGSGCSTLEPAPSWQNIQACHGMKATSDVAALADPSQFSIYDSHDSPNNPWMLYGGTSMATPMITAMYAMAGVPGTNDNPASYPYGHANQLFDITTGTNGNCGAPLCMAGLGWDGPTGVGTPNGVAAFNSRVGPVVSGHSGYCADVTGANSSDGTPIIVWQCSGAINQQWTIAADGTLRSLGKCMDAKNGGTGDGTPIVLATCGGAASQQWAFNSQSGALRNVNAAAGHGCLDVTGGAVSNGTQLELWSCSGAVNQQWTLPA